MDGDHHEDFRSGAWPRNRGGDRIERGERYDSYFIFLNRASGSSVLTRSAQLTFDRAVVAILGDANAADIIATNYFGAGTTYAMAGSSGIKNGNNGDL